MNYCLSPAKVFLYIVSESQHVPQAAKLSAEDKRVGKNYIHSRWFGPFSHCAKENAQ